MPKVHRKCVRKNTAYKGLCDWICPCLKKESALGKSEIKIDKRVCNLVDSLHDILSSGVAKRICLICKIMMDKCL